HAFSRGSLEMLRPDNPRVLAFLRQHGEEQLLVVANLSRFVQPVQLDLRAHAGSQPEELFGRTAFPRIGEEPYFLTLGPHGFFWFALPAPGPVALPAQLVAESVPVPILDSSRPLAQRFEAGAW